MIITKKKDIEKIVEALKGKKTVWLFGCDSCAEQCRTGGGKELEEMAKVLTERGFEVAGSSLPEETCYRQLAMREYRTKILPKADAVLSFCGAGVRTVADVAEESQPVLPALDSYFWRRLRGRQVHEGARYAGVLIETGGICPHTGAEGLLNGPCGGVVDGMCEVAPDNECAWVRIYKRLKGQGRLHLMKKIAPPKDNSIGVRPRNVLLREAARPIQKKR